MPLRLFMSCHSELERTSMYANVLVQRGKFPRVILVYIIYRLLYYIPLGTLIANDEPTSDTSSDLLVAILERPSSITLYSRLVILFRTKPPRCLGKDCRVQETHDPLGECLLPHSSSFALRASFPSFAQEDSQRFQAKKSTKMLRI
jgi:hypothetical protein